MRQHHDKKGQITIDFLATLTVVITLFFAITLPLMHDSLRNASMMQSKELINANSQKIQTITKTLLQEGAGAQQEVSLRTAPDCYYYLTSTTLEGGYQVTQVNALCTGDSAGIQEVIGYPAYGIDYQCPACENIEIPGTGEAHPGVKGGEKVGLIIRRIY